MGNINELIGKTFNSVRALEDELFFEGDEGNFKFYHVQDCCESVEIVDIIGDLKDLEGSPILVAEERTFENENPKEVEAPGWQDSYTWTFYEFRTQKGSVTVRWYGESNGYYSESVNFTEI